MQQHGINIMLPDRPPSHPPPSWPWIWSQKVKIPLFQNMVMVLQIKLKVIRQEFSNMVAIIWSADPPPPHPHPGDGVSRSKVNFSEHGHVANQITGNQELQQHCYNMVELYRLVY